MRLANINRDYLFSLDVKSGKMNGTKMYFFNTDVGTSNFYVKLVVKETKVVATPIDEASNYSITMYIVNPNNVVKSMVGVLVNEEEAIYEFNLPSDFTDISGEYSAEFWVNCLVAENTEKITSDPIYYTVNKSITSDVGEATIPTGSSLRFNAEGELEVTIDGVTKVFTPKQ